MRTRFCLSGREGIWTAPILSAFCAWVCTSVSLSKAHQAQVREFLLTCGFFSACRPLLSFCLGCCAVAAFQYIDFLFRFPSAYVQALLNPRFSGKSPRRCPSIMRPLQLRHCRQTRLDLQAELQAALTSRGMNSNFRCYRKFINLVCDIDEKSTIFINESFDQNACPGNANASALPSPRY